MWGRQRVGEKQDLGQKLPTARHTPCEMTGLLCGTRFQGNKTIPILRTLVVIFRDRKALRASPKGQTDSREHKMGHLRRDCSLRGVRALDKYDLALISHLHITLNSVMGTHSPTSTPHQCCFLRIFWTLLLKFLLFPPCGLSFNTHSGPQPLFYVA